MPTLPHWLLTENLAWTSHLDVVIGKWALGGEIRLSDLLRGR